MNVSLDGYIEDTDGSIELSTPDDEMQGWRTSRPNGT
jgi:hypothetical protein